MESGIRSLRFKDCVSVRSCFSRFEPIGSFHTALLFTVNPKDLRCILNHTVRQFCHNPVFVEIDILIDRGEIQISHDSFLIHFDMQSLRIFQADLHRIHKRNFTGIDKFIFQEYIQGIPGILIV